MAFFSSYIFKFYPMTCVVVDVDDVLLLENRRTKMRSNTNTEMKIKTNPVGKIYSSYFCSKNGEAVLTCTHNKCFGAKIRK